MSPSEKRRHPRKDVFSPVLIALGDEGFLTEAWDLSRGGARLGRPARWAAEAGASLRLYFLLDQETVITLAARLVRVGVDHLGVEFSATEEERIQALLYEARFLDQRTG